MSHGTRSDVTIDDQLSCLLKLLKFHLCLDFISFRENLFSKSKEEPLKSVVLSEEVKKKREYLSTREIEEIISSVAVKTKAALGLSMPAIRLSLEPKP